MIAGLVVVAVVVVVFISVVVWNAFFRTGGASGARISSFTASVEHTCSGDATTLTWNAVGSSASLSAALGSGQTIDETLGTVPVNGTQVVHLRTASLGSSTARITLTVSAAGASPVTSSVDVETAGSSGTSATIGALNVRCGIPETVTYLGVSQSGAVQTQQATFRAWPSLPT